MLSGGRGIDGLDRLDLRLVALLGLALLPIGIIAMVQTYRVISDADANAEAALAAATIAAADTQRDGILRVRGATQIAAAMMPRLIETGEDCSAAMQAYAAAAPMVAFAGYVDEAGVVRCGSDGVGTDVTDSPVYQSWAATGLPQIGAVKGAVTGENVLILTEPVAVADRSAGYVALSIPQQTLDVRIAEPGPKPILSLTFTDAGQVLWSPDTDLDYLTELPSARTLDALAIDEPMTMRGTARSGEARIYTVAPLLPGEVYALSVWRTSAVRTSGVTAASAILFPLLMWLVTIGTAYFAVHRLVVRHIRALRMRIRAFTANRSVLPHEHGTDVPSELREVIEAFHQMTERIVQDEAEAENSLREKDVLLKEVHHRVKNNLQLISSMINMQLRKTTGQDVRFLLRRLQDRVLGLATIHRNLYQASVLSRVDAGRLIDELVQQCLRNSDENRDGVDVRVDIDAVLLHPDQAVPLSLLVTEAFTNALKYVDAPEGRRPWISVELGPFEAGGVRLRVANSVSGSDAAQAEAKGTVRGLGRQLMGAFVMQLDATLNATTAADAFTVEVIFDVSDFRAAG